MTHTGSTDTPRGFISGLIPEGSRDYAYSLVTGLVTLLMAIGTLDSAEGALWTQLVIGAVTLLYALVYSPSTARAAIYAFTGPVGAVLMGYGLIGDARWAIVTAGVGQVLGLSTAAVASGRPYPTTPHGAAALTGPRVAARTQRS